MKVRMPGKSHRGPLPPVSAEISDLADELRHSVDHLSLTIGERHVGLPQELERAARFVEEGFNKAALEPQRQEYRVAGVTVCNVQAAAGSGGRTIVIGAHYDTVPGTPGANDNASGVAALLAIAKRLAPMNLPCTLRLVAFVNEEPPFFLSPQMGSFVFAKSLHERGEDVAGMLSLETLGYYSDEPNSQKYPLPFRMFYPSVGNFVAFVGNSASKKLVSRCAQLFREHVAFPCEGGALPEAITGVGWSDHWSFWQHDFPALMVTDTAPFRFPHYHMPEDTPDTIDFDRMARVVDGLCLIIPKLVESST